MLHKLSCILTKFLLDRVDGDTCEEEIYIYGFELIISTIVGLASIMTISWVLADANSGLIFIILFVPLRIFTGGYHANTYSRCFVISNLAYLSVLFIKICLASFVPCTVWLCVLGMVSCYIVIKAPLINHAQPISEYKQKRSKYIVKYILVVDIVFVLGFAFRNKEILSMTVLSICLVAVFMLITDKSIITRTSRKE